MSRVLRIAFASVLPTAHDGPLLWGLLQAFEDRGLRVQSFLSRALFLPLEGATTITGQSARQLDTWLMSHETCRQLFARGTTSCDLAVVDGAWDDDLSATRRGGSLRQLCEWLDLPAVAVVDVAALADCHVPPRPQGVQAVLLHGADCRGPRLRTLLESLWGIPVVGWLELEPALRSEVNALAIGQKPSEELCRALGARCASTVDLSCLAKIATARPLPWPAGLPDSESDLEPLANGPQVAGLHIALAYDEVFNCYFADTLEALEAAGARVTDFSPLADERLPSGADIVYFGCGHPERFAAELAANECMVSALRSHLCDGRRIYAEGGGLAYLCQQIDTGAGQFPAVGALPAIARRNPQPSAPEPVEVRLARDTWLAPRGATLRGYLNSFWELEPAAHLHPCLDGEHAHDLVCRHQAIGSRLHLHFAVQAPMLRSFFAPHAAALDASIPAM